jgi:rubrerythrin
MTTTSPEFTTTYETGGSTAPALEVYVNPERLRMSTEVQDLLGGELNPPFIIDFLSAALMHEQCGRHLYRSVAGRTQNPMLKSRYEHFGDETEEHITILRNLVAAIGADPGYVSASARATEKLDHGALEATFMLDGSLDIMTRELAMLDAVVLAETVDRANWQAIEQIGDALPDGPDREAFVDAVARVAPQEDEHLTWAQTKRAQLIQLQATRPLVTSMAASAETAMEWFKGLFSSDGA